MDVLGLFYLPDWMLTCALLLLSVYLYATWTHSCFVRLGIKGPKPGLFGVLLDYGKTITGIIDIDFITKYGKVVGIFHARTPVLLVADLDMIKTICVKDFQSFRNRNRVFPIRKLMRRGIISLRDDHWKASRSILTPTFSSGKIKQMLALIDKCVLKLITNMDRKCSSGESIEMSSMFGNYTMDVVFSTLFGLELDTHSNTDSAFVKHAKQLMSFKISSRIVVLNFIFPFLFNWFEYFDISPWPNESFEFMWKLANETLEAHRKDSSQKRLDLLEVMLKAHTEHNEDTDGNENVTTDASHQKGFDDAEISANAIVFMLAGYDTTCSTLAFSAYSLATNPDVQDKVIQEIDEVLGEDNPTYDNIAKLTYLDMFVSEVLRLYPPALRISRELNHTLEMNGVTLEKGVHINIPIYAIHHLPEYWPEPETFQPERFSAENKAKRNPYCYLPFGLGPRNCIGKRLAQLEIKFALIKILQKFRFITAPETVIPIQLEIGVLLRPDKAYLRLESRA